MKKLVYFGSVILMALGVSQVASARYPASEADSVNEITTNLTRGYLDSEKRCSNCSSGTDLYLSGAYNYYWKQGIQIGGEGSLGIISSEHSRTGSSETLLSLAAVGTYNLEHDLKNSIFVKAGVGFYPILNDTHSGYDENLGIFVGAGKRFQLWNNISYSPELRLVKKGNLDLGIEISLINLSIFW